MPGGLRLETHPLREKVCTPHAAVVLPPNGQIDVCRKLQKGLTTFLFGEFVKDFDTPCFQCDSSLWAAQKINHSPNFLLSKHIKQHPTFSLKYFCSISCTDFTLFCQTCDVTQKSNHIYYVYIYVVNLTNVQSPESF